MIYKDKDIVYIDEVNLYRVIIQDEPFKVVMYFDTIEEAKEEIDKNKK